jgi:hypothetical protein
LSGQNLKQTHSPIFDEVIIVELKWIFCYNAGDEKERKIEK